MPDITGAVDVQVERANRLLFMRLLSVLVIRAGGKLTFPPRDLRIPPGTLAYALERGTGGIRLAWVPMEITKPEETKETTEITMPDASAADEEDAIDRLCLGAFTLKNGTSEGIRIEGASAEENAIVNRSELGRFPFLGGGFFYVLRDAA